MSDVGSAPAAVQFHDGGGDGVIAEVRLNRPEARNALNMELLQGARQAVAQAAARAEVRAIVLTGEGKAFCAGMDLKEVRSTPEKMGDLLMAISLLLREIRRVHQPTIAIVQGAAIGGGCGLMSICDFAISHEDARIGYPEVGLGVCPAVVAPWLIRKLGAGRARHILLAGGTMTGKEALQSGLLSHLVPTMEEVRVAGMDIARNLCKGGPGALAATKQWLNELDGSMDDAVLDKAAEISARIVQSEEAQARLAKAFDRKS